MRRTSRTGNGRFRDRIRRMSEAPPLVYLARHGETAWSLSGQHTGLTDLPLTEQGERNARNLGERLMGLTFATVLTSPLQRAARTFSKIYSAWAYKSRIRPASWIWWRGSRRPSIVMRENKVAALILARSPRWRRSRALRPWSGRTCASLVE